MEGMSELDVLVGREPAGRLGKAVPPHGREDCVFTYRTDNPERAISVTMPLRAGSYDAPQLHPIFVQNLPEGYLGDIIRRTVSKLYGSSELALLAALGPYQIGRLSYEPPGQVRDAEHSTEQLETLLSAENPGLFAELVEKYALHSGISGVQPKLLIAATSEPPWDKAAIRSHKLIVKAWGQDFPHLALNEYFCMSVAKAAGLRVPHFDVSRDARLFIMERFDVSEAGGYLGFEDGCVMQGRAPAEKYDSTYERLARSISDYVSPLRRQAALAELFGSIVVSWAVRNGDAHLKNFGILYDRPGGTVDIAPAYDIVTTTAYLRNDVPALHMAESKRWWPIGWLARFGTNHCGQSPNQTKVIIKAVAGALVKVLPELTHAAPRFPDVAEPMIEAWEASLKEISAWL